MSGRLSVVCALATFSLVLAGVAAPVFELAKEGTVRAAIVLPAKPNGVEAFAAEELKYHLDKMFAADDWKETVTTVKRIAK